MTQSNGLSPAGVQKRLTAWFHNEFDRSVLPRSLSAGLILFMIQAILAISFSALIFKGALSDYLSLALTYTLVGSALLTLFVSLLSSYPGSSAAAQDTPAVILVLAAAHLAALFPASASSGEIFSTTLFLILGATLSMGVILLGLGFFKLGGLVRFLPYPVMGGFLAGTGWLLAIGGIDLMQPLSSGAAFFSPEKLMLWIPGLVGGLLILYTTKKWPHPMTLIIAALSLPALFYLVLLVFGIPLETVSAGGWLLGPFPETAAWSSPFRPDVISQVNWTILIKAFPEALPAVIIGVIALLLNASSLELIIKKDMDINRELVGTGIANIIAVFGGGLIGYHAISLSKLNHTITKGKRLPGVFASLLMFIILIVGVQFLSYIPRLMLGSLLVFIGSDLLYEWVIQVWSKFPKVDAMIVMTILITIILKDFLWGIGLGMVLTIIMFVVNYSRVNIIRYTISGTSYRSRHNRDIEHTELLQLHGDQIHIIKLEGFLFFGTANYLYENVQKTLSSNTSVPIRYIILDFEMVNGMDSTSLLSFEKMLQFLEDKKTLLIFSGLSREARNQFAQGGFGEGTEGLKIMFDLDRAVEWCETNVINENSSTFNREKSLYKYFIKFVPEKKTVSDLIGYMEKREFEEGEYLMRTGDSPNEMLFIESGKVTVQLQADDGDAPVRLETTGGGRVIGELGFYLGKPRTADVVADVKTIVYILCKKDLARIKAENPEALYALSQIVINQTSQRIVTMTRVLDSLRG